MLNARKSTRHSGSRTVPAHESWGAQKCSLSLRSNGARRGRHRMNRIGYLRVSTCEQKPHRQIDGLRGSCDRLFIEKASAAGRHRPVYERVTNSLERGDILVIWDLDRAYRSAKDALNELDALRKRGIDVRIINFNLDTTTPMGRFVFTMMSALAEFERSTLSQRTKEGIAAARRRGARIGRPPKLTVAKLKQAQRRIAAHKESVAEIADDYDVAPWTLTRALKRPVKLSRRTLRQ